MWTNATPARRRGATPTRAAFVLAWREALSEAILDAPDNPRPDWGEGPNQPYFTGKLDRDGYAALMLHAAHAMRLDIGRPEEVPDVWQEDEAYKASTGENLNGSPCGYFMAPKLCLPGDFLLLFQCTELRGQEVVVGSTEALLVNLHGLNEQTFPPAPKLPPAGSPAKSRRPRTASRPTPATALESSSTSPRRPSRTGSRSSSTTRYPKTVRDVACEALETRVIHNMLWIHRQERWISGTGVTNP